MPLSQSIELALPFRIDPATGGVAQISGDSVRLNQHIVTMVGTVLRERLMVLGYGSTVRLAVFGSQDPVDETIVATDLQRALSAWEPAITLHSVNAVQNPGNPAVMDVTVEYSLAPNLIRQTATIQVGGSITVNEVF